MRARVLSQIFYNVLYCETMSVFFFILESVFQVILSCEVHAKVEATNLHNWEMVVFGRSATVLKSLTYWEYYDRHFVFKLETDTRKGKNVSLPINTISFKISVLLMMQDFYRRKDSPLQL